MGCPQFVHRIFFRGKYQKTVQPHTKHPATLAKVCALRLPQGDPKLRSLAETFAFCAPNHERKEYKNCPRASGAYQQKFSLLIQHWVVEYIG